MQTKDVYLIFTEGETEDTLFGYLKARFNTKNKSFKPQPSMVGVANLTNFKGKYKKIFTRIGLKRSKPNEKVHFVFLIDNDLDDSDAIANFIRCEGHLVQLCDKNTETVLLRLSGTNLAVDVPLPDFRKKSKTKFKEVFGKEAQHMKAVDFEPLFNEAIFEENFPVLHTIFNS